MGGLRWLWGYGKILEGPLTRLAAPSDLSPEGEVKNTACAENHLSLGGEVGAKRRVRGPWPIDFA
ncbi:MAG: hypothetical protein CML24_14925 [Rhizobiales bacterium]|nr:hypothetical protein [Hyphomicrobiales bacterium]|tara:strand:- start:856 stop:1050 length:195 start_codon:yes stop_codon:yes gene_type:complete